MLWLNTEVAADRQQWPVKEERNREQLRGAAALALGQDEAGHEHGRVGPGELAPRLAQHPLRLRGLARGHPADQRADQFEFTGNRHADRMPQTRCEWIGN